MFNPQFINQTYPYKPCNEPEKKSESMSEEKSGKQITLSFTEKKWQEMKSILESYEKRELSEDYVMGKLQFWAYKSIESNMHSIELQVKYKP